MVLTQLRRRLFDAITSLIARIGNSRASGSDEWRSIFSAGQWTIQVKDTEYRIVNLGENQLRLYYEVVTGKYGEPRINPEPDLSLEPPAECRYCTADGTIISPDRRICGLVSKKVNGERIRLSLSNARTKGIEYDLSPSGVLTIGEHTVYLNFLLIKDRNRIDGYDAFFGSTPVERVRVIELEDLADLLI